MVRDYSERLLEVRPESSVALEGLAAWACAAGEHALTAKFCTLLVSAVPGAFRRLVQPGAGAPEIGPLASRPRRRTRRPEAASAILRSAHQPGDRARATRRHQGCARRLRARHQGRPRSARAALERRSAAGALRPDRRGGTLVSRRCSRRRRRKRKRASAWAICACSARISAPPPRPSKAVSGTVRSGPRRRRTWRCATPASAKSPSRAAVPEDARGRPEVHGRAPRPGGAWRSRPSDFDAALEYHVRLIDLGERSAEVLYNAGLMYEKAGQLGEGGAPLPRCAGAAARHAGSAAESGPHSGTPASRTKRANCWSKALEAEPDAGARILRSGNRLGQFRCNSVTGNEACHRNAVTIPRGARRTISFDSSQL